MADKSTVTSIAAGEGHQAKFGEPFFTGLYFFDRHVHLRRRPGDSLFIGHISRLIYGTSEGCVVYRKAEEVFKHSRDMQRARLLSAADPRTTVLNP